MGMVGCYAAVSSETLQRLRDDPESIDEYLNPNDGDGEPPNFVDLDKAWHAIHYLLTGQSQGGPKPLALAVFGGKEFGPEVGYGSARFLTPVQVAEVFNALSLLDPNSLRRRFDPQDMKAKDIYPENIWIRDDNEALIYIMENFERLTVLYRDAAARGDGMLQWLS